MVKTRSLYLTWHWIRTGSWRTDGRTDRIPIANTPSQTYLPVQLSRAKIVQSCGLNNAISSLKKTSRFHAPCKFVVVVAAAVAVLCSSSNSNQVSGSLSLNFRCPTDYSNNLTLIVAVNSIGDGDKSRS